MGDRANIKIRERDDRWFYLYTHWDGTEWPAKLQSALGSGRDRWDDQQYLQCWIVKQMVPETEGPTGYGLSICRGDNEHDVFELDTQHGKVRRLSAKGYHDDAFDWEKNAVVLGEWTFEEFVALDLEKMDL